MIADEMEIPDWGTVQKAGVKAKKLDGRAVQEMYVLYSRIHKSNKRSNICLNDISLIILAKMRNTPIYSEDKCLRAAAESENCELGTLHELIEELYQSGLSSAERTVKIFVAAEKVVNRSYQKQIEKYTQIAHLNLAETTVDYTTIPAPTEDTDYW